MNECTHAPLARLLLVLAHRARQQAALRHGATKKFECLTNCDHVTIGQKKKSSHRDRRLLSVMDDLDYSDIEAKYVRDHCGAN